jgi:DNA helicase-4
MLYFPVTLSGSTLEEFIKSGDAYVLRRHLVGLPIRIEGKTRAITDVKVGSMGYIFAKVEDESFMPRHLTTAELILPAEAVESISHESLVLKKLLSSLLEPKRTQAAKEEREKEELYTEILNCVTSGESARAKQIYEQKCTTWMPLKAFEQVLEVSSLGEALLSKLKNSSLGDLDRFYREHLTELLSVDSVAAIKAARVKAFMAKNGIKADDEQIRAISSPCTRVQVRARAGSGKTRTLSARAALTIQDEKLDPNQVLILAFNKVASVEIKERVEKLLNGPEYCNARTFHSLAYQLAKPTTKILFDQGEELSTREQSMFAQRMLRRIINPAFQAEMVQFFREELEEIESIGRDLPPEDYYVFRRALEHVTLGGQWIRPDGTQIKTNGERVKSKGEKYIADFLFEHDIPYKYERAWMWKAPFLGGATYKPDFSFFANGYDIILEHWAFDPSDSGSTLPSHWRQSAKDYREQIEAKRVFWASKGIKLIETHTGMLSGGREEFEARLKETLEGVGIDCAKLPDKEIVRRVFQNDFMLTRMARLFVQFISRAKKRGWTTGAVSEILNRDRQQVPRIKSFQRLALRAFREYELMKEEESAIDFDDLLIAATRVVQQQGTKATIHLGHGRNIEVGSLKWILLDEYQDFSPHYYGMLKAILDACPHIRLVAVGDDWQAINSFAGAELDFFNEFESYFPGGERISITTNYRSGLHIVQAGNAVMSRRGQLAKEAPGAEVGRIEIRNVPSTFVQFVRSHETEAKWREDQIYLPEGTNGKASEYVLRQAQVFKICTQVLRPSFEPAKILETAKEAGRLPHVLFLSRTGYAYGLDLGSFKSRMVEILVAATGSDEKLLNRLVHVSTAHGSKGREANTVIVLDATEKQFPKIHPDNLLFEIFGVTQKDVLAEERRLFYVAISRAVHRLVILTDREKESHYLKLIPQRADLRSLNDGIGSSYSPATPFERHIFKQLGMPIAEQKDMAISAEARRNQEWDIELETDFQVPF